MATYLGVEITLLPASSWLNQECNNTAADYRYETNWLGQLKPKLEQIILRGGEYGEYGLDECEEALYSIHSYLVGVEPAAKAYRNWLYNIRGNAGFLGGNSSSCNQSYNKLTHQYNKAALLANNVTAVLSTCTVRLAAVQAFEQGEINEEVTQNFINNARAAYDAARVEIEDALSDLETKEFLRKFQQFALPILLIVLAFFIFRKS